MPRTDLSHFDLIRFRDLHDDRHSLPDEAAAYIFLLRGGNRLLRASSYFEMHGRRPVSIRGHALLYAGAAQWLDKRLEQHFRGSNFGKTLLSMEFARRAVSLSGTPRCRVRGQRSLTGWLRENAVVGVCFTEKPFDLERQMLQDHASPLNISWRRELPFSRQLIRWNCDYFPTHDRRFERRVRYL